MSAIRSGIWQTKSPTMHGTSLYQKSATSRGVWLSAFDVQKIILPIRQARGYIIPSHTAQAVVAEHGNKRRQFKKSKLRWRVSSGSKKSLGWIPFKKGSARFIFPATISMSGIRMVCRTMNFVRVHLFRMQEVGGISVLLLNTKRKEQKVNLLLVLILG